MALLVVTTADAERRVKLPPNVDACTVGRDRSCVVVLEDPDVAAKHAVIARTKAGWTLLKRRAIWINGDEQRADHLLRDGDEIRLARPDAPAIRFRDAGAWLRSVAPWATSTTPARTERLKGGVIRVSADEASARGLAAPLAFELGDLACRWDDDLLCIWAERPPGPERVAIEAAPASCRDLDDLRSLMAVRIADATEAALAPVDTSRWEHASTFHWLPVGGAQCHASSWCWERGLWTSAVRVPVPDSERAAIVAMTTPETDPSTSQRLRAFLRSFRFSAEPVSAERARLVSADRTVSLDDGRARYTIGSAEHHDIVVSDDRRVLAHHATLTSQHGRWSIVAQKEATALTRVNGAAIGELPRPLWDGDELALGSPGKEVTLHYLDDVYYVGAHRRAPRSGDATKHEVPLPPDPTDPRVYLGKPFRASFIAPAVRVIATDAGFSLRGPVGTLDLRSCATFPDPAWTLNAALASDPRARPRSLLRRGLDGTLRNPRLFGEPCRMLWHAAHHAIVAELLGDAVCIGIVVRQKRAILLELYGGIEISSGVCRSRDEAINEVFATLAWDD